MVEKLITITAEEAGFQHFSRSDCRAMIGKPFPIEDAKGNKRGEGVVTGVKRLDAFGMVVRLSVSVPDQLAINFEADAGRTNPFEWR